MPVAVNDLPVRVVVPPLCVYAPVPLDELLVELSLSPVGLEEFEHPVQRNTIRIMKRNDVWKSPGDCMEEVI